MENHLRSLEALKQDTNQEVFISMITSKLPREVLIQLEIQKGNKEKWTVTKLRQSLNTYVMAREAAENPSRARDRCDDKPQTFYQQHRHMHNNQSRQHSSAEALVASSETPRMRICRYCYGKHWSDECQKVKTIEDRKKSINGSCYICLKPGHLSRNCRVEKACYYCKRTRCHHRSLCPKKFSSSNKEISHLADEYTENSTTEIVTENSLLTSWDIVLMQTAQTRVRNIDGREAVKIRLLLDCGSQRSYVTESLANRLKLKKKSTDEINLVVFGAQKPKTVKTPKVSLKMDLKNGSEMEIDANVVPKITGPIQRRPIKMDKRNNMKYLWKEDQLADSLPTSIETSTIDILIGNDYYLAIVLQEKVELHKGLYLLGSKLGWILTGLSQQDEGAENTVRISESCSVIEFCLHTAVDSCIPVKPPIEEFWNLETIGIRDSPYTSDDEATLRNFQDSLKFENRRYKVTWPWRDKIPDLPVNRELAYGRLKSLVHKLKGKPELLQKYNEIIQDQLKKGIIEKVSNSSNQDDEIGVKHYIPHHAVIDPTKATTKVRIVYDASAKTRKENKSLNECLHRGPVLLHDLCGLLMRFRLNRIAVVADIEKAFLQVGLQHSERDAASLFWLNDIHSSGIDNNIQVYRFCRVPFGVISSPFLLAGTLGHHLKSYGTSTAENMRHNVYVDNVITGVSTVEEAVGMYNDAKQIFKDMSMNLREWASNSQTFLETIHEEDRARGDTMKVLGLTWSIKEDSLSVSRIKTENRDGSITKREVLHRIASVFDPLGFFTPVTLKTKLFFQMPWDKQLNWDDQLEEVDVVKWKEWSTDLDNVSDFQLPRCITTNGDLTRRLLCFCDASSKAYACSVYLQQTNENSKKTSDLIFFKSRLAPRNKISLPMLELMAVLIGVRCMNFVEKQLKIHISERILWTDSQCVLHWIFTKKPLTVFVENRLKEIRKSSEVEFRYVSTKENPADVASRGTSMPKISEDKLWWNGPTWLKNEPDSWPKAEISGVNKDNKEQVESEYKVVRKVGESTLLSWESPVGNLYGEETLSPGICMRLVAKYTPPSPA